MGRLALLICETIDIIADFGLKNHERASFKRSVNFGQYLGLGCPLCPILSEVVITCYNVLTVIQTQ